MIKRLSIDYRLLSYFGVWFVFGLVMLSSASVAVGLDTFHNPYYFVRHQLLFGFLPGLVLFFLMSRINYIWWKRNAGLIMMAGILLLVLVLIPGLGVSFDKGARSWFRFFGFSFQPAEVVKLGLIIFFADHIVKRGKDILDFSKGFLPSLLVGSLPILLILLQPDLGTAVILFGIIASMLFASGVKWNHIGFLVVLGIVGVAGMALLAPYRIHRLTTFLHPELDPQGVGYQINQAFLAVGSGGWFGLGLGHSRQKFQYLPEVQADSIFAVTAEELGFILTSGFIVLVILISRRALTLARYAPDEFSRLVIVGITSWLMIQTFMNIGAIIGLLPLTGVPLPFVSHGGSAVISNLAAVGLLLSISRHCQKK